MADEHGDVSMCLQMPQFVGKPLTSRRPPKVAVGPGRGRLRRAGRSTLDTGDRSEGASTVNQRQRSLASTRNGSLVARDCVLMRRHFPVRVSLLKLPIVCFNANQFVNFN